MSIDRDTARVVVPPVLALGLIAVLVNPLASASPLPENGRAVAVAVAVGVHADRAPDPGPTRLRADGDRQEVSNNPVDASSRVVVSIPPVAFAQTIRVQAGRLRTPVVLTVPGLTGTAQVSGKPACRTDLVTGRVVWVDCRLGTTHATLRVQLSDGRVFTAPV